MSPNKRKLTSGLADTFETIKGLLITIKPKLIDPSAKQPGWSTIHAELLHLSSLAESFTKQRPRSNKEWISVADTLDREGVWLWNVAASIPPARDDHAGQITAAGKSFILIHEVVRHAPYGDAAKLAGFRLVEAGLEQKPSAETLIHVLHLASKAGASLSASGNHDAAGSVLGSAAKYEDALKNAEDLEHSQGQARARVVLLYYSSRMEAAWREGNDGIADFMLSKIDSDQLNSVMPRDRELLVAKMLEIGKSVLKAGSQEGNPAVRGARGRDAVKWLQKAFTLSEPLEAADSGSARHLKRSILRSLARAYFLSSSEEPENLVRAEASLNELISSIDSSEHTSAEYQQLRWMRIAVLKKRKAGHVLLLEAFQSIIDHMAPTDSSITDILQELRGLGDERTLVVAVHQRCLQRVLDTEGGSHETHLDRVILSLLFHCSKGIDHAQSMRDISAAFKGTLRTYLNQTDSDLVAALTDARFELSKISATACLTLLWQSGDRLYQNKRWQEAADWYLAGTHKALASISGLGDSKCLRKAALCYIQQGDFSRASVTIRRCAGQEAATYYIKLLIAVRQGFEDEAIGLVRAMVNASGFDRKTLMLATQLANESDMKNLLLSVLEALLETMGTSGDAHSDAEALTLSRCIIRLILKLMGEPGSNRSPWVRVLIGHFRTAILLIKKLGESASLALVTRDISWLWRAAYNCAIQGCSEWEHAEASVSDIFDIARQLLESYRDASLTETGVEIYLHIIDASFATVAGRVFELRKQLSNGHQIEIRKEESLRSLLLDITSCRERIRAVTDSAKLLDAEDISRSQSYVHVLRVFEVEMLCHLRDWEQLLQVINETIQSKPGAMDTYEAITDVLWVEKDCPVNVLFTALEAILHASLDRGSLSIEKFSRWLRAICTMLLSRNTAEDRTKAIGYVEQAVNVLEDHTDGDAQAYPIDERQWLLGTSYNTGIECLQRVPFALDICLVAHCSDSASLLDEAKRWFEASTTICRFVPDGESRANKISETYTRLLERYATYSAA
ncbi:meiosis protein SPO22/ZIP4 like-domain-containing protein [Fomitopsis serialis]|uniref:meiosis protein SPO22/ZIP4 like-domain-containing protein n=1 Tax=Fomitopsis serialis TaxID=139415 RepID=UPI0020077AC7|nr:meiosis protein SPO22/ZIP4 like-domain-containing protein [Neoantrodia serialis]KAH9920328.1 meiosis protein SPO22/ZIP4 like-domain-containing protein [Neoantrodia serialis]